MTGGLGIGSALSFSRALRPSVSKAEASALAAGLATASRAEWLALTRDAEVRVASREGAELDDPVRAWDAARKDASALAPEEVIAAGDHLPCVLSAGDTSAAVLARIDRGRIDRLRWVWSVGPR